MRINAAGHGAQDQPGPGPGNDPPPHLADASARGQPVDDDHGGRRTGDHAGGDQQRQGERGVDQRDRGIDARRRRTLWADPQRGGEPQQADSGDHQRAPAGAGRWLVGAALAAPRRAPRHALGHARQPNRATMEAILLARWPWPPRPWGAVDGCRLLRARAAQRAGADVRARHRRAGGPAATSSPSWPPSGST